MKATALKIPDVILLEPKIFGDQRGFFYESFNQAVFNQAVGYDVQFVQDNHSKSQQGVLRGLHYQLAPKAQGKLVRVVQGEVFDVVVDIRKELVEFGVNVDMFDPWAEAEEVHEEYGIDLVSKLDETKMYKKIITFIAQKNNTIAGLMNTRATLFTKNKLSLK